MFASSLSVSQVCVELKYRLWLHLIVKLYLKWRVQVDLDCWVWFGS